MEWRRPEEAEEFRDLLRAVIGRKTPMPPEPPGGTRMSRILETLPATTKEIASTIQEEPALVSHYLSRAVRRGQVVVVRKQKIPRRNGCYWERTYGLPSHAERTEP